MKSPRGRKYNSIVIRRGDSTPRTGIRHAAEKGNSFLQFYRKPGGTDNDWVYGQGAGHMKLNAFNKFIKKAKEPVARIPSPRQSEYAILRAEERR
jgi:hypothetical protein